MAIVTVVALMDLCMSFRNVMYAIYAYVCRLIIDPWTLCIMSAPSSEAAQISQEENMRENRSLRPAFGARRS